MCQRRKGWSYLQKNHTHRPHAAKRRPPSGKEKSCRCCYAIPRGTKNRSVQGPCLFHTSDADVLHSIAGTHHTEEQEMRSRIKVHAFAWAALPRTCTAWSSRKKKKGRRNPQGDEIRINATKSCISRRSLRFLRNKIKFLRFPLARGALSVRGTISPPPPVLKMEKLSYRVAGRFECLLASTATPSPKTKFNQVTATMISMLGHNHRAGRSSFYHPIINTECIKKDGNQSSRRKMVKIGGNPARELLATWRLSSQG